jgi:hypothetical protein
MIDLVVQLGATVVSVALALVLTRAALGLCLNLTFGRGRS